MRLSPHFESHEFDCHDGTPVPAHAYDDLRELCRLYLEPLRARWGPVHVISGYRPRAYNAQVGGAPQSFHIYLARRRGAAADVSCSRGAPESWAVTLDRLNPPGLGRYPGHVHVDTRAGHARW